ncbi:MAG: type II secretion system protein [Patescibacteria group bacterium]|jgi:type IV pilus assembly protein PilA
MNNRIFKSKAKKSRGFTLLELLVVIGIIGILAAIVIVAINPGRQFAQARNAQRWNDVNAILNSIHQYAVDNNGVVPAGIDGNNRVLGTDGSGCDSTCGDTLPTPVPGPVTTEAACFDLDTLVVPDYLTAIPFDPATGDDGNTDYYVTKDAGNGRVTVAACDPELSVTISVSR